MKTNLGHLNNREWCAFNICSMGQTPLSMQRLGLFWPWRISSINQAVAAVAAVVAVAALGCNMGSLQ